MDNPIETYLVMIITMIITICCIQIKKYLFEIMRNNNSEILLETKDNIIKVKRMLGDKEIYISEVNLKTPYKEMEYLLRKFLDKHETYFKNGKGCIFINHVKFCGISGNCSFTFNVDKLGEEEYAKMVFMPNNANYPTPKDMKYAKETIQNVLNHDFGKFQTIKSQQWAFNIKQYQSNKLIIHFVESTVVTSFHIKISEK